MNPAKARPSTNKHELARIRKPEWLFIRVNSWKNRFESLGLGWIEFSALDASGSEPGIPLPQPRLEGGRSLRRAFLQKFLRSA
jgi:hypothetical protein